MKAMWRPVRCPECGRKIMDAERSIKIQFTAPAAGRYPDFMIRCRHCGAGVGVTKN